MNKQQELILIPKYQEYTEYMLEILIKIPRIEKFSMGNWYKQSMYETLKNIIYFNKITEKQRVEYLNIIDTELHIQRIYLRIMCKQKYIDTKKFNVAIEKMGEIGKRVGGLMKYYATNH